MIFAKCPRTLSVLSQYYIIISFRNNSLTAIGPHEIRYTLETADILSLFKINVIKGG